MTEPPFPGYNVLDRSHARDAATLGVVLAQLRQGRQCRFFTKAEAAAAEALFCRLLALDDETEVAVLDLVDERLAAGGTDGWRYDNMPGDVEVWRRTLRWLDSDASEVEPGCAFAILDRDAQIDLLERIYATEEWHGLPAAKVWSLWAGYACAAFFSHSPAGNDTGGGGTA
jgi:hypothetical protein